MAKPIEVKVPDIGDYQDVPVIEVLVQEGQRVDKDTALITLESEKATMEVPSPAVGTVRGIKVRVGGKVSQGDVIMTLEAGDEASPPAPPKAGSAPTAKKDEPKREPPLGAAAPQPSPPPPPEGGGRGEGSTLAITVPDIGDYHDVPVIEVLVKDGDAVEKDAPLIVLESEKATMEVPAPVAGTVRGLKVKAGAKVSKGAAICELEIARGAKGKAGDAEQERVPPPRVGGGAGEGTKPAGKAPSPQPSPASGRGGTDLVAPWTTQAGQQIPHASPMVRRVARDFGVDLAQVQGSGPHGRILQEDVQSFVKQNLAGGAAPGSGVPKIPAQDFAQFGEIETKPLSRIRKLSATHLVRAWLNVPHVTQHDEADITELEAFRKAQSEESGVKLTLLPIVMKAVGVALRSHPEFNAALAPDGENLILKKYCHIGFAADTENGLVVPVVRDVWAKGIVQLAHECAELAKKARESKLKPDEMKGGCFSISSLGGLGVTGGFTPIVNAPEVAILGVSRATMKPVWNGKEFAPRLMLPLSLSYDHRVIDGAYAARFTVQLVKLLADLRRAAL